MAKPVPLSIRELALRMGVSDNWIRYRVREYGIPSVGVGKRSRGVQAGAERFVSVRLFDEAVVRAAIKLRKRFMPPEGRAAADDDFWTWLADLQAEAKLIPPVFVWKKRGRVKR